MDFDDRAELLAGDPGVYYLTDHYVNYAGVLVRLSCVNRGMLRDLLGMGLQTRESPSQGGFAKDEAPLNDIAIGEKS